MVQMWDLGFEMCKKSCVGKCPLGSPHLCLGAALKLTCSALTLAWAVLQLCLCLAMRLADLEPDPQTSFLVFTSHLPWVYGLACQSLQYWLMQAIVTSPDPFLQGAPLLMRLVPLCALLSPLAYLPLKRSPILLLPGRCVPRCFGNCISENNTTEYWNPDISICTLYHKIASKAWCTTVVSILCTDQETFLNKLVTGQIASSGGDINSYVTFKKW